MVSLNSCVINTAMSDIINRRTLNHDIRIWEEVSSLISARISEEMRQFSLTLEFAS